MKSPWVRNVLLALVVLLQVAFAIVLVHSLGLLSFWQSVQDGDDGDKNDGLGGSTGGTERARRAISNLKTPNTKVKEFELNPVRSALSVDSGVLRKPSKPLRMPKRARTYIPAGAFWKREDIERPIRELQRVERQAAAGRHKLSS